MSSETALPFSKESEMMVLGCMLNNIDALNVACEHLVEADFYLSNHKILFQVLYSFYKQDKPVDLHLCTEELKRRGQLEEIGGNSYLLNLAQYAGTAVFVEEYVELVKAKSTLRRMVHAARKVEHQALSQPEDVHTALDEAQQLFFRIGQAKSQHEGVLVSQLLEGDYKQQKEPYLELLQKKQELFKLSGAHAFKATGIPTHFIDLDKLIHGLGASHLLILAARPAMGKTALALNIAENICFKEKQPVAIFSLEMTAEQLLHRLICSQAQVESEKIRTGNLSGIEFQRIASAVAQMQEQVMIIDDQPGLKITDLKARARRLKESYGIQLLVIDYLQLISGSGNMKSLESRQNEISEISRLLKTLARELDIPILCLSQLSRKVEDRAGHRPLMSDLRESGCLTADSLVLDATGAQRAIASLVGQAPFTIESVGNSCAFEQDSLIKTFYSGTKQVFTLKTVEGFEIKATANHPFLTPQGWVRLDHLLGEQVAIKSEKSVIWDRVHSITGAGIQDVFDATVLHNHNFVANHFVVHNSIEQDSDIILFLLRREYYDAEDKPGLAELIVAKNRHGSIGNIPLTFVKELAQFRNFTKEAEEDSFEMLLSKKRN